MVGSATGENLHEKDVSFIVMKTSVFPSIIISVKMAYDAYCDRPHKLHVHSSSNHCGKEATYDKSIFCFN
jgi:hypothetical protein